MTLLADTRARLLRLADDCEERARRRSCDGYARGLFHRTANDARVSARTCLDGEALDMALQAALATARFAAYLNGGDLDMPMERAAGSLERMPSIDVAPAVQSPAVPGDALNARQLASLSGMVERSARRTIERGVRRGLPGFYRDGCHWYAERLAFDRLRAGLSELCPNESAVPSSYNAKADHSPPPAARWSQAEQAAGRRG